MRHNDATREDLRRLAMWLTVEEPALRSAINEALDTVEHAAKGEFWSEAKAAPECHQEAPFMYKGSAAVPELVTGTIDLTYLRSEGWRVVDYKTDEGFLRETSVGYRAQVSAYEQAWTTVTGIATTGTLVAIRLETGPSPSGSPVKGGTTSVYLYSPGSTAQKNNVARCSRQSTAFAKRTHATKWGSPGFAMVPLRTCCFPARPHDTMS